MVPPVRAGIGREERGRRKMATWHRPEEGTMKERYNMTRLTTFDMVAINQPDAFPSNERIGYYLLICEKDIRNG